MLRRSAFLTLGLFSTLLIGPRAIALAGLDRAAISTPSATASAEAEVATVLDDFHSAAALAAGDRYFGHFATDAIFLGTDPGERWTLGEFRAFADPYFSKGQGWTYVPVERNVVLSGSGDLAWFDELLDNDSYGRCRGSGVLRKTVDGWKIVQYNLTMVIPNDVARDVAAMIRDASSSESDRPTGVD